MTATELRIIAAELDVVRLKIVQHCMTNGRRLFAHVQDDPSLTDALLALSKTLNEEADRSEPPFPRFCVEGRGPHLTGADGRCATCGAVFTS